MPLQIRAFVHSPDEHSRRFICHWALQEGVWDRKLSLQSPLFACPAVLDLVSFLLLLLLLLLPIRVLSRARLLAGGGTRCGRNGTRYGLEGKSVPIFFPSCTVGVGDDILYHNQQKQRMNTEFGPPTASSNTI